MSDKELKQILQEIKDDCRKRKDCEGCKFDTKYGCRLDDVPNEWDLIGIQTDKWHKLYSRLVDIRAVIYPHDFPTNSHQYAASLAKVALIDDIMSYMAQLEQEEYDET